MSNANRKAKVTTMTDKKLDKAKEQIVQLAQQLQATNMSLLNMRQMYEGAITEKHGLQAQLSRVNAMLTAAIIQSRGKKLRIKAAVFEKLQEYIGFDTSEEDGDLILSALSLAEVQAMEEDLEQGIE